MPPEFASATVPAMLRWRRDALYFSPPRAANAQAVWLRVHDVVFGPPYAEPGQRRCVALGAAHATHRWFISPARDERCIALQREERGPAHLTVERVTAQWRASAFLGRSAFDPDTRTPAHGPPFGSSPVGPVSSLHGDAADRAPSQ